jgi:hypothetical protein
MGACCLAGWRNGFSAAAALTAAPASISDHRGGRCQSLTPPKCLSLFSLRWLFLQAVDDFLSKEVNYVVTDRPEWVVEGKSHSSLGLWPPSVASPAVPEEAKKKTQVWIVIFVYFFSYLF